MSAWIVDVTNGQKAVLPVDDMKPHEPGEGCWCHPTWEDDVLVHHAMDKREDYENGRRFA